MKIVRFCHNNDSHFGVLDGQAVKKIEGDIFGCYEVTGDTYLLSDVKLLAPVNPPDVIAIGLNYRDHAGESGVKPPTAPVIFLKASSSVVGDGQQILLPAMAPNEVDYEAELAVVIGKTAKRVSEADALDYVMGYTCGNDVSARDCQLKTDSQWARGKSFDTFCPIGPYIETDVKNPDKLDICSRVNGVVMQRSNTKNMIFSVRNLISYCSHCMTLHPGSVIMTGTPEGVGFARKPPVFLKIGDVVEVEIESVGLLKNTVAVQCN